jgi:hypothetical protein
MKNFEIITDLRKIKPLFKSGILKSNSPFKYVDNGDNCKLDIFFFKGKVYELQYRDGCFYPYLFIFIGEIISQNENSVTINYEGIAGYYLRKVIKVN